MSDRGNLWSIVLAAGEGERMRGLTEKWLGYHRPKQYCTFVGTRSMLQHTLDRAERLTSRERIVTVIARSHRRMALEQVGDHAGGLMLQPFNHDTAAGIFLALTRVRKRDPKAVVVVLPSDHFVSPEAHFLDSVRNAVGAATTHPDKLVLLGVAPDTLELDYGWVAPGRSLGTIHGRPVEIARSFLEKPGRAQAMAARDTGALWNTMVMAVEAETLWQLGWRYLPEIMPSFESLLEAVDTPNELEVMDSVYRGMVRRNFSSRLLERARGRVALMTLENALWSDWGRPERIIHTLERIGKMPAWKAGEGVARTMGAAPSPPSPIGADLSLGALNPA
ncbi:MAG: sugar phosphate nucleotidyltransferase [Vicinamibacteria bacterium]